MGLNPVYIAIENKKDISGEDIIRGQAEYEDYYRRTHKRSVAHQVGVFDVLVARCLKVKWKLHSDFNRLTKK